MSTTETPTRTDDLITLLKTREISPRNPWTVETLIETAETLSPEDVARWTDRVLQNPVKIPDGRYAITYLGQVKFYRVVDWKKRPGFKLVWVQAGDEEYPIKNADTKAFILDAIREDVEEASKAYGRLIGHCGVCNRTLTNPESIQAGLGPVCAERNGWTA